VRTTSTRLLLLRHGESSAQLDGIVSGHSTCTGLSDRGREQAASLGHRLANCGDLAAATTVYSSLMARASETATVILDAARATRTVIVECAFCELHPGDAEGLTWSQLVDRYPPDGDPDDPYRRRLPGMELWTEMHQRVGARLRQLADEHRGETIVVVGHGGTVSASFIALGDSPLSHGPRLARGTQNASITEWAETSKRWILVRYNDVAHLERTVPTR
jgi:probable phosphoglycerate mutase